jgi:TRAP-type C4-dicarboxylate transport system permease small subunit
VPPTTPVTRAVSFTPAPDDAGPMLRGVRAAVGVLCLLMLALLVLTPMTQVVMRGVFSLPFSGAEELARYFLLCLTFIGASWVTARGGHIRMEEFQVLLPPRLRWLLQLLIDVSGVVVFAVFLVASLVTIAGNLDNQTATLELPFWLFMGPLAIGSALMVIETSVTLRRSWRRGRPEAKQTTLS